MTNDKDRVNQIPTSSKPNSVTHFRLVIAGLILSAHFTVGINVFSISPILPEIIHDLDLNRSNAGLLVSLPLLIAACFGLIGGVLAIKLGVFRSFTLGWFLMGTITFSVLLPEFLPLIGLRMLYGVGTGLILTTTGPILIQWFKGRELMIMNALNTATLSLGIASSVSFTAPLTEAIGWDLAISSYGLLGLIGGVPWVILGKPKFYTESLSSSPPLRIIKDTLTNRSIILLLAADAGVLFQYTAFSGWFPTFFTETRGMNTAQSGFATGLLPLVGVFSVLLGGLLPLKMGRPRLYLILPGIMILLGGPSCYFFENPIFIYSALIFVGIGSWLYVPTLLSQTMELANMAPEKVSVIWGSLITFSGLSMFISPVLVGIIQDVSGSFIFGFIICSIASSTLLLSGIFLPKESDVKLKSL